MDSALVKTIISRFDRNAFEAFFQKLFNDSDLYRGKIERVSNIDERIFDCPPERFYQSADAFFMCYEPYTVFNQFASTNLNLAELKRLVGEYVCRRNYGAWLPIDGITLYIINNFDSQKIDANDDELLALYESMLMSTLPNKSYQLGVGNINTLMNEGSENAAVVQGMLHKFLTEYDDGICISISDSGITTSHYYVENEFSGVTKNTFSSLQSVIKKTISHNSILGEFNKLLFSNVKEGELEEFLLQYYQEIFGGKYDRISTQLWLKFPALDIGGKDRRLDIFMRNSIIDDWELFELKRADIKLTKTNLDVPAFNAAVHNAISQVKNYKRILGQDSVKRALADDGIEYYEPEINLIIGKRPSIPTAQWRRILADNKGDLKIITYDDLYKEAAQRLKDSWALGTFYNY